MVAVLSNGHNIINRPVYCSVVSFHAADRYGSRDKRCGYDEIRDRDGGRESTDCSYANIILAGYRQTRNCSVAR